MYEDGENEVGIHDYESDYCAPIISFHYSSGRQSQIIRQYTISHYTVLVRDV